MPSKSYYKLCKETSKKETINHNLCMQEIYYWLLKTCFSVIFFYLWNSCMCFVSSVYMCLCLCVRVRRRRGARLLLIFMHLLFVHMSFLSADHNISVLYTFSHYRFFVLFANARHDWPALVHNPAVAFYWSQRRPGHEWSKCLSKDFYVSIYILIFIIFRFLSFFFEFTCYCLMIHW